MHRLKQWIRRHLVAPEPPPRIRMTHGGVIQRRSDRMIETRPDGTGVFVTRYEGTPLQVISQLQAEMNRHQESRRVA
jgi:hypothetical protein